MKFTRKIGYVFILLLIGGIGWLIGERSSSAQVTSSPLETALCLAEENRVELDKVLHRYKNNAADSLKYKAACFLIENMPYHKYQTGEKLEEYLIYYRWLKESLGKGIDASVISDSVKKVFGPIDNQEVKYDIQEIDSAYLCRNIDWAFKVWQEQPWGKNVPFDTFCEYLLPYRIDDEVLADWREEYYEKYNPLLDSLRLSSSLDKEDPVVAVRCLMDKLQHEPVYLTSVTPMKFPHVGPKYAQYLAGTCREFTDYCMYVCRALGIPCAIDFVSVHWGLNAGHFWMSYWDKDGEPYMNDYLNKPTATRRSWLRGIEKTKVYRHTFSLNRKVQEEMKALDEVVYPFWAQPRFVDVTDLYTPFCKEKFKIPESKLYPGKRNGQIAYLCCSFRKGWLPVDWTKHDGGNLEFHQIQKGSIMRVATYEDGNLYFLSDPFDVDQWTNELQFYPGNGEKQDMVLYAKYSLERDEGQFQERMLGGVFEGSNDANFAEKDTLFMIQQKPYRLNTNIHVRPEKQYRYMRYMGRKDTHCNVSEVTFYAPNDTAALKGEMIGTPGCAQNDGTHEFTNVFDGKSWTSFDYSEKSGGWAGLDFGKPVQLGRIVYTPRNRDNYIRPGDEFELFYCQGGWKSAGGRARSASDSLVYRDMPKDALFLLVNYSRGVQERIFAYEKGTQRWR